MASSKFDRLSHARRSLSLPYFPSLSYGSAEKGRRRDEDGKIDDSRKSASGSEGEVPEVGDLVKNSSLAIDKVGANGPDQAYYAELKSQPVLARRKSRLDVFTSLFPSLISSVNTDSAQQPKVLRKPIPQDSPAPDVYANDQYNNAGLGIASSAYNPSAYPTYQSDYTNVPPVPNNALDHSMMMRSYPTQPNMPPPPVPKDGRPLSSHPVQADFQFTETKPTPQLPPDANRYRRRSSSFQTSGQPGVPYANNGLRPRGVSPDPNPRGRSSSAQPFPVRVQTEMPMRNSSANDGSHSDGSHSPGRDGERRGRLRRNNMPGGSRSNSQDMHNGAGSSGAWILGQNKVDYNTALLMSGEKVPELWNELGNVYIFLQPKSSGLGPCFKIPSSILGQSQMLCELVEAEITSPSTGRSRARSFTGRDSLSVADARRQAQSPPTSPPISGSQTPGESRLYMPAPTSLRTGQEVERQLAIRNLFAFLTGQPLVASHAQPTPFNVFLNISSLLYEYQFSNIDGSTFGEAVELSFGFYLNQLALADVRHSREKTLEALVLGERMRSWDLYNEAFAHAVGKYSAVRDLNSPLWQLVSRQTQQRLERAHLGLISRQHGVNTRLESFDFPSLFSGIANSTSHTEYKNVRFSIWKKSFSRMRQFVLSYYKSTFGNWPPKARSKKNPFSESGLNRLVLKILYSDLCALYDLIADRESLTPRVIDQLAEDIKDDELNPHASALRKVLTEFDHSSPPVLPPIPFDLPRAPDMTTLHHNYYQLPPKDQIRLEKGLNEDQRRHLLSNSYDLETAKIPVPFLADFKDFEQKEARGKTTLEMADQRYGYWLFLYVVIQSVPMLVVDAPGLRFTEGVEYFLCEPPKGNPPWMDDAQELRKRWYEVSGGAGVVQLSADTVEFSIEGVYQRSHCWLAAKNWGARGEGPAAPPPQQALSPLQPPQSVFADMDPGMPAGGMPGSPSIASPVGAPQLTLRTRNVSPAALAAHRSSIWGPEPVNLPPDGFPSDRRGSRNLSNRDVSPAGRPTTSAMRQSAPGTPVGELPPDARSTSRHDRTGSTFDDILKDMNTEQPKKKRGFF